MLVLLSTLGGRRCAHSHSGLRVLRGPWAGMDRSALSQVRPGAAGFACMVGAVRDPPGDGARQSTLGHGRFGVHDPRYGDHEPIAAFGVRPQLVERHPDGQTSAKGFTVSISGWRAWHEATIVPGSRGVTPGNASTRSPSWFGPVALQAALVGQPGVFRAERGTELVERGRILPLDESHERGWRERGILPDENREFVT